MNKKLLSLVLALVMVLGTFTAVFAETEAPKLTDADAKVQWLIDNKIVEGRKVNANAEDNDLALDKTITRAEVTKLVVYALGYEDLATMLDGAIKAFPDVELNHWANGYISVATTQRASVANNRRIVVGYPEGNFLPENNVTYAELATMLVRIVDKDLTDKMEDNAIWATSYMSWAAEAKLLDGLKIEDSSKAMNRKDAFVMLYNALYELGKTNYNKVDFGAKMGVVSKLQAGKIQLNQDNKQEYKIDWNTVMTGRYDEKESGWKAFSENSFQPGALVRVIVDKDGVATHIIQLGYNGRAYDNSNWKGVADKAVDTNDKTYAVFGKTNTDKFETLTLDGVKMDLNKDTKYFVADKDKNVYKEVETLNDAFYYTGKENIEKVYAGYNEFKNWNEAKVVVFGKVQKDFYGKDLVRVLESTNSLYNVWAQDTKDNRKEYNLRDISVFPGNYSPDKYDVINLAAYANDVDYGLVIDSSKANVYRVHKLDKDAKEITLMDKDEFVKEYFLKDTDVFLNAELKKGVHVQIKENKDNAKNLDVVSVVPFDLKGNLKDADDSRMVEGKIVTPLKEVQTTPYENMEVMLEVNGRREAYKVSNVLPEEELEFLTIKGAKVKVSVTDNKYDDNYGTIKKVTFFEYPEVTQKAIKALDKAFVEADAYLDTIKAAVDEYNGAFDEDDELIDEAQRDRALAALRAEEVKVKAFAENFEKEVLEKLEDADVLDKDFDAYDAKLEKFVDKAAPILIDAVDILDANSAK
ncbi:MAG: S-layer homology domain-containing protein [Tissierellia bacterium]|nr:S-layer homology domain-containing protein [Tissierellia bacterium]